MTGAAAKLIFIQTSPHIELSPGLLRRTSYGVQRFERLIPFMMYVFAASLLPLSDDFESFVLYLGHVQSIVQNTPSKLQY